MVSPACVAALVRFMDGYFALPRASNVNENHIWETSLSRLAAFTKELLKLKLNSTSQDESLSLVP